MPRNTQEYPDDIFDNSRMSFGDHIEELRTRLIKALYGLGFCLMIGFILDYIGEQVGKPNLGIGRPMLRVITEPVETQVRNFYLQRNQRAKETLPDLRTTDEEADSIRRKLKELDGDLSALSDDERRKLMAAPTAMPIILPIEPLEKTFGLKRVDPQQTEIELRAKFYPAQINAMSNDGEGVLGIRRYLTTLSAQEAFMVYFKVSLLCGVVIGSPWIFYQVWAFVAAGLYPHEKRYVHLYLPLSVTLFVGGVLMCQFLVLPGAVKALLAFNNWIDLDPDLRLNEWLGFALVLPVVFGVSFQTPLVMFFLSRIRMLTYDVFLSYWRTAIFVLAVFAAVITPTPDVVTMMYLFVPMFGLYMIGVLVCYWFPPSKWDDEDDAEAQVAV